MQGEAPCRRDCASGVGVKASETCSSITLFEAACSFLCSDTENLLMHLLVASNASLVETKPRKRCSAYSVHLLSFCHMGLRPGIYSSAEFFFEHARTSNWNLQLTPYHD